MVLMYQLKSTHPMGKYSVKSIFILIIRFFFCFRTKLQALHSRAPDAYLYPKDDTKTHGLSGDGKFVVVFEW